MCFKTEIGTERGPRQRNYRLFDHAHLKDEWFESAIVAEWRVDQALVPYGWPDATLWPLIRLTNGRLSPVRHH